MIGRLSEGAAGREAAALLKEGAVRGLSFGYRVRAATGEGPRELIELELVEISLVTLADAAQGACACAGGLCSRAGMMRAFALLIAAALAGCGPGPASGGAETCR